ncbi:DUF4124 domain-containing protein [Thalassotalea piscium]|uniref:DUF4124 domain-containing protein n=1 Tax=Thalassotalea piscium TaxID=1230533 RepID=A0A7X0NKK5_9GAMM|nr:DUF4124 domain-containing protein [Thalassotalea piscium]MBB6545154.1 hypothetical protein [Thalassotalea piscium]
MKEKYIALVLVTVSFISSATNVTIYRWVDDKQVVHFSQQQPEHENYTELSMSSPKVNSPIEKTTEKEEKVDTQLAIQGSKDKCEEAKANLQTLMTYDKIQYKDEGGAIKILGKVQKQQQIQINKAQVEVYCRG